jgi:hypothetical protein
MAERKEKKRKEKKRKYRCLASLGRCSASCGAFRVAYYMCVKKIAMMGDLCVRRISFLVNWTPE